MTDFILPGYEPAWRGKVRDIYEPPELEKNSILAIVTSDRVSAFDNVVGEIPGIGILRNRFTNVWKKRLSDIVPTDFISSDLRYFVRCMPCGIESEKYLGRVAVVRRLKGIPIEAIVRNFMTGSLWDCYVENSRAAGYYWGVYLPNGLVESQQLPLPVFTPTTKAPVGQKDKPLEYSEMVKLIESWIKSDPVLQKAGYNPVMVAQTIRSTSLAIYGAINSYAYRKGILLADLKLEFGLPLTSEQQGIYLMDEISPDCFRVWPVNDYAIGTSQTSLDKQPLRNFMRNNPGAQIPDSVIQQIYDGYKKIYNLLCSA